MFWRRRGEETEYHLRNQQSTLSACSSNTSKQAIANARGGRAALPRLSGAVASSSSWACSELPGSKSTRNPWFPGMVLLHHECRLKLDPGRPAHDIQRTGFGRPRKHSSQIGMWRTSASQWGVSGAVHVSSVGESSALALSTGRMRKLAGSRYTASFRGCECSKTWPWIDAHY